MNTPPLLTLTLRSDTDYLSIATAAIRETSLKLGFAAQDAEGICLALEEAVSNAIEYGYGDANEMIDITVSSSALGLELAIKARCLPLDQEQLPKYDPQRALTTGDASGLSLLLMKEMMDQVGFSIHNDVRKTRMIKRLPASPVQTTAPAPGAPLAENVHIQARSMRSEEAEDIALLAFRSHDAVFFCEHIYYPERIREMNQSGEMASIVLSTDDDEIIGHGALVFYTPNAKTAEMTYAFIDPRYRKHGGITLIAEKLLEKADQLGLCSAYALAVTNHPYSQRPLVREGFKECGLLLESGPATNQWHSRGDGAPERIANLALVKYLRPQCNNPLYLPSHHKDMIQSIYAHIGNTPRVSTPSKTLPLPAAASIEAMSDFTEGWAAMDVITFGTDVLAQVQQQLAQAIEQKLFTIYLTLPLEDQSTAIMTEQFESLGFFFTGITVREDGSEGLLLQYLTSKKTDYSLLDVHTDFARQLVEYVRSCDPREG